LPLLATPIDFGLLPPGGPLQVPDPPREIYYHQFDRPHLSAATLHNLGFGLIDVVDFRDVFGHHKRRNLRKFDGF